MPTRRIGATVALLCLGSGVPVATFAQATDSALMRGRVTGADGDGMPGVTVTARSTTLISPVTTITGPAGAYLLPLLPAGDYVIAFDRADLYPVRFTTTLAAGQQRVYNVTLRPVIDGRDAITVNIDQSALERRTLTTTTWARDMDSRPVLGGVSAAAQFTAGPVATQPDRARLQIGGAPVGGLPVRLLPPLRDTISSATFAGGPMPASAGWLQAGAIDLVTRSGSERWSGSARLTAGGAGLDADEPSIARGTEGVSLAGEYVAGGPLSMGRVWAFAAASHAAETLEEFDPGTGRHYESARGRQYLQARGTIAVSGRHLIVGQWLSLGADRKDAHRSFSQERSSDIGTLFYDGWVGGGVAVSGRIQQEAGGAMRPDEWTWRLAATTLVDRGPGAQMLSAGYEGRATPDRRATDQSVFFGDSLQGPGRLTLDLGIRLDHFRTEAQGTAPGRSDHAVSPRFFASWSPAPHSYWAVRGGLARHVSSDDDRQPLSTRVWTVGVDRRIGSRTHVSADLFRRHLGNISDEDTPVSLRHDGLALRANYEIGEQASVGGSYTWSHLDRDSHRGRFWGRVDPLVDDDLGVVTVELLQTVEAGRLLDTAVVASDDDETLYRTDFSVRYWRRLPGTVYGRLFVQLHLLNVFDDVRVADRAFWDRVGPSGPALTMPRTIRLSLGARF